MNVQFLLDKILSYEGALKQIDDKINLIKFIGSVNYNFIPTDLLDLEELKQEKRNIKKSLRSLRLNFPTQIVKNSVKVYFFEGS